jgi:protein ImuB
MASCSGAPGPLALTQSGQGGIRLVAVDRAAATVGLAAGMRLADARALVPALTAQDADPAADAASLAALADWCNRWSPLCAVDGSDGIRLDITGCAHLFGGENGLAGDAARRLRGLGFAVRMAVADTQAAAWGWARHRPAGAGPILPQGAIDRLLGLPVAALRLDPEILDALKTLGLDTVKDVAALPRAPLGQRLGPTVLERLDSMFGRLAEPMSPREAAEPWVARRSFAEPIGRREDIDAVTLALAQRLCHDLSRAGQGARRLDLGFFRVDGTVQRLAIGTSRPNHAAAHLMRLFAERLDAVDPGFGIEAMVLEATETGPVTPAQATLSGQAMDATDLAGLIDRLQNRLGPDRVTQIVAVESHVPEWAEVKMIASPLEGEVGRLGRVGGDGAAFALTPARRRRYPPPGAKARRPPPQGGRRSDSRTLTWTPPKKAARPIKLLPAPEPITAMALVPDDPPLSFRRGDTVHVVVAADGPERIGPEWWRQGAPRKPRDYYRVEDSQGRRFWLYREGLYGGEEPPRWFLHGFFA